MIENDLPLTGHRQLNVSLQRDVQIAVVFYFHKNSKCWTLLS